MTDQRQASGRHNEAEFRNKPPRIPRVPEPTTGRQTIFTVVAIWIIFVAVLVWFIGR